MINLLGTIVFTAIIGIGSIDGRSDLTLLARYVSPGGAGRRPRRAAREHRGGEDQTPTG